MRIYLQLSKARLSTLVVITTLAGFLAATPRGAPTDWSRLGWTLLGTSIAAAAAAMWNQLLERRTDAAMERTAGRPLPAGRVSALHVFISATLLSFASWAILLVWSTVGAAMLALGTIVLYAAVYTPMKKYSTLNTVVGAVTGATPPLIGWVAARNDDFGGGGWTLAALLFVWQLPHFFALSWMYRDDYARGGLKMLPVFDPDGRVTALVCLSTSLLLVPTSLMATLEGVAGIWYALVATMLGLWLSWAALKFAQCRDDANARRLFYASLLYLPPVLAALVIDRGPATVAAEFRGSGIAIRDAAPPVEPPPPPPSGP
ncbi:MAG: heme o synthase [Planctomycetota bacterium]|nr:heme o synthase [Planctomycetota bacterium]